ncbi:protein-S-isoprenylcysteine O-methyltransferase [Haoranjiania flava]|uniref:Protein-S-isoprenylcysteine O-methyltransferase n=1 Tax=Haoranjiania flava TaxID=1856322 RepID=A0AAE3ILK3_9BACT|nr:protein-S-isoprenylcysteine O-methyltransferase [Haoranjiania flava]MCU7693140.1 protein-S-isoprenylcysteine O-methyltransferase [Haoranjiania flava]
MNELIYKILLVILVLSMNVIRRYYQKRYKATHALTTRQKHQSREKLMQWLMFFSLAVPGIMWLFTDWLSFAQFDLPDSVRILGFVIGICSMLLFGYVHKILGDNWSPVLEIRPEHELVISGPYKWVRHPMYSAMLLWLVSFTLISANWLYACSISAGLAILFVVRIPDEEKLMLEEFGEQYKTYVKQAKRLIPFIY